MGKQILKMRVHLFILTTFIIINFNVILDKIYNFVEVKKKNTMCF